MQLARLYRYPVKALPGERLDEVTLTAGEGLPHDRRFALSSGTASAMDGAWMPCRSFFINAINDGLLRLTPRFDAATGTLQISGNGRSVTFTPGSDQSPGHANATLADLLEALGPDLPPRLAERRQQTGALSGYWDFADSAISIINLASVDMLSKAMGVELDLRRFRGNLLIEGLAPWEEFGWLGKRIAIGDAELEVFRPAQRCPATSVNPDTAMRDLKVPDNLQAHFGHAFLGMYAQVVKSGSITPGDGIRIGGTASLLQNRAMVEGPDYRLWPKMAEVMEVLPHTQSDEEGKLITLRSTGPWPLPQAAPGQRLRIHLGPDFYTAAEIKNHHDHTTVLHVTPSQTGDPATAHLLEKVRSGDQLIASGPFGKS